MGIGKYQKICILLLHTGFWIEFWRENSNIFPVFVSLILGQNLDFGTKIQKFLKKVLSKWSKMEFRIVCHKYVF